MASRTADQVTAAALEHTRQQLLPFRWSQWWRLAALGLISGELGGRGCSFQVPSMPSSGGWPPWPGAFPWSWPQIAIVVAALLLLTMIVGLIWTYVTSVCRFVLIETVVLKRCGGIRAGWVKWRADGRRYFWWQVVLPFTVLVAVLLIVGIPAAFAIRAGWFSPPGDHLAALVVTGGLLLLVVIGLIVAAAVARVLAKDFVAPVMAIEHVDVWSGWRRVLDMIRAEKGRFAGYILLKIVFSIVAGFLMLIVVVVAAVPVALAVVAVVLGAHQASGAWTAGVIGLAVALATLGVLALMSIGAVASVPMTVFFPAFGLYFLASRYDPLEAWMHPPPPAPPTPAPDV